MNKKFLLFPLLALTTSVFAQAPKYVLFEHFTQASCGPCAQQNPAFEANILLPNTDKVRHIAYHTSWPGVDPMNAANATEVADRVTVYNVTGVPNVVMLGNKKQGAPGNMTQADVDAQFSMGSPVKIDVTEVDNVTSRDITVTIKTLGTVPAGNYKLYTAVVENPINFTSAPGNNGETHFPNVFRKMYPSTAGEAVTVAAIGGSVSFNYTYTIDPTWIAANIKVVSFLQNTTTKEVLNVGTIADPIVNYSLSTPTLDIANVASGASTSFELSSGNTSSADEDFIYTLTNDAPADWTSSFMIDTATFTSSATLTVVGGATLPLMINVTPGATRGIATYTLTVTSVANPNSPSMSKQVYVISGVTDLIVNGTGYVGDGTTAGSAANWGNVFTAGLVFANNQGYASTNEIIMEKAITNSAFQGVNNVYYNVGWSFPSMNDQVALSLQNFMDAGGNLFISGQDLGWEIQDAGSTFGTAITKSFYTNYLHAAYVADGGTTNTPLTTNTTDAIFADIAGGTINNFYGTNFYPDQINVADTSASVIFKYGTSARVGGIRAQTANYKVVYIAPGMEMLSTVTANDILKRSHDWFYGYQGTASIKENSALVAVMGQNYPNPSNGITSIALEQITENMNFDLIDITGKIVLSKQIAKGSTRIDLNTSNFASGKYLYRLSNGNGVVLTKAMMIK